MGLQWNVTCISIDLGASKRHQDISRRDGDGSTTWGKSGQRKVARDLNQTASKFPGPGLWLCIFDPFCNQRNLIYQQGTTVDAGHNCWQTLIQSPASPDLSRTWKSKTENCKYTTINQFSLNIPRNNSLLHIPMSWDPCIYLHVQLHKNRVRCTDWLILHPLQPVSSDTFGFGSAVSTSQRSRTWFHCYWNIKLSASSLDLSRFNQIVEHIPLPSHMH